MIEPAYARGAIFALGTLACACAPQTAQGETFSSFDIPFDAVSLEKHLLQEQYAVDIREFHLAPMGHLLYDDGKLELHPKALLLAGYDSNLRAEPSHGQGSAYGSAIVGLDTRYFIDRNQMLTFAGEVEARGYEQDSSHDLLGLRADLRYDVLQSEDLKHRLEVFYYRLDDPLIEGGEHAKRGIGGGALESDYERRLLHLGLEAEYINQAYYDEPIPSAQLRDSNTVRGQLAIGYRSGSTSEWQLKLVGGAWAYEGDGPAQDAQLVAAEFGWRGVLASRFVISADAGVQSDRFADDYNHDPAYDDRRVTAPVGHLVAGYLFEELSSVQLRATQDILPSAYANALVLRSIELKLRYRLRQNASLSAGVEADHLETSGAAAGRPRERRDTATCRLGGDYQLREGLALRLALSDEQSDSRTLNDYRRWTAQLEMAIVY